MLDTHGHWFAPIVARPVPEFPDRITVGVVFGNGRLEHLEIDEDMHRLSGVLSYDHRRVLQDSLRGMAERLYRLESLEALSYALGVMFEVCAPRPLLQPYSTATVRSISRALLRPLKSRRERDGGLLRESLLLLDSEMAGVLPPGVLYQKKRIEIADLYPGVALRYETGTIGPLRRVAMSEDRHLILSSVIVRETDKSHLDQIVQRTLRQSFFLKRLRPEIRTRSEREFKLVGVLQPLEAKATGAARDLREFYAGQWRSVLDEVIVPNSREEASERLQPSTEWLQNG